MSPVVVLLVGFLIVFIGATGRWEAIYKDLTGKK